MAYIPQFHITPHLLTMIEEISAYRQKIVTASLQVPWIPILRKDSRSRTAHSSTAIEGNPLTLLEVKALEEGKPILHAGERSKNEIFNQLAALRWIEKNQNKKTVTRVDLLKLHKIIAKGVMDQGKPGEFRTFAVSVGQYVPPASTAVPKLMKDYLQWWNEKATEWSPVISSAILHYHFEEIHPFADGNGRMGRGLALWELYRRGFDTHHIFSVDEVYWENRPRYYRQLDSVRQSKGDLTGWLEYSAEAIHLTLERVLGRIGRLVTKTIDSNIVLTPKQEKLLNLLRESGGLSPKEVWMELKITKQGAIKILNPLLSSGLIKRIGTRKSGKYILG